MPKFPNLESQSISSILTCTVNFGPSSMPNQILCRSHIGWLLHYHHQSFRPIWLGWLASTPLFNSVPRLVSLITHRTLSTIWAQNMNQFLTFSMESVDFPSFNLPFFKTLQESADLAKHLLPSRPFHLKIAIHFYSEFKC